MSAQGFRECKQTLWSLFQSYSFVDTARASPHSSADTSVGPHGSEGLVSKVVREPEFRSIMAAFTQRSTFERFFTLADDTDADDALLVERAMARLTSEATLVKLWAIMAKTRARLQRGAPPAALATTTHSAKGKSDWLMEEEDSLEALPRAQQTHQGVPLADIEVSPSVAVNWTVLSSVLYLYMHDSLRLRTVDEATIAKARAAIRVEGAASTGHADPTEDRKRDGVAATRMSIAVDADSYRPARETSEAPRGQQAGKPLAQPEQLHRKLDRAPLEALHRMLSVHNDAKSSRSGLATARPSSICEEEDGSESRGRGTIEIPVEDEEGDEGHTDTPLRREPSPCVTTVLAGTAPAATAERSAAYRDSGSPAREEEEAVVPEQSGDSHSNNISPRKHHHTTTPTRRTRQQRQEEALRRLATPKRRQCGDNGEATPPKQQQQQQQCRPVTPRRRNAALPKTPTTPMPLSSEEEPRRLLPSPSKLCSSGPRGVGNGIAGGGTGPDTTGVGSGGGSSRELRKPAPPPRRKHTQKEAAAASVIRRRGAEDEEVLPNTEGLRSPQQQQQQPLLHRTVPERLARMPPARSPSPAFPLDLANALEDAGTSGSPRSSGSVTVVKEGEGIATAETGQLRGASRSPPPREPHAHAPHKHMAYISQNTGTTTTTTGSHASGGLRQREPSEANQWSGRSSGKAGQKREAAPVPNAHTSEANATLTGATHANTGTPFMIRTRGRTGGAAGTNAAQPERQRRPLQGRRGGPSLTALPQPEQHVPAVGVAADPVRSPSSASMNEGRRTTALPVEASDINDRATPPLQPPLVEPHGENGDFDVDALTAKPGVGSEHGGHNATAAADSHSAPTSEGEELPPTALSRARLRVPSPQRVATAPSVSITPRDVHGGGRGDGFFASMPPPTTRESPLDHRCNGGGAAGRHLPLGDEQRQHSSHVVGGHQHRGLANEAVAGVSAGQQQQQQSHAPMETREPRLTGQDKLAEDTTEGPVPYPEPPGLRPTMFLRAAPYSHLHGARSCHDSGGVHSNNNNNNNGINADVQCTPPKQVYHRDGGGGATGDARDRPSIRVTPGGDTEGEQSRLFTVASYDADEHFYNLHNRTSATPPSHNSTPHKAFVTPRCSCRSLRPPAMGNLSPTPRGNCDGLSPPPPARLSARARKLSRSASRGSRRLCNDDEANSTGSITAPRVPLTRCHSSNAGGDLQVAVLVSPRRTCGGGGSSLAAMTALASSPLSPPASVAPRVSRQPPQPSPGMKQ